VSADLFPRGKWFAMSKLSAKGSRWKLTGAFRRTLGKGICGEYIGTRQTGLKNNRKTHRLGKGVSFESAWYRAPLQFLVPLVPMLTSRMYANGLL
jgi:hypothetical protein